MYEIESCFQKEKHISKFHELCVLVQIRSRNRFIYQLVFKEDFVKEFLFILCTTKTSIVLAFTFDWIGTIFSNIAWNVYYISYF